LIFTLVFWPFKMLPKLTRYLTKRAQESFVRARQIHGIALKHKEAKIRLATAIALAAVIAWQLYRYDLKMVGLSFTLSSFLAIYSGLIYKTRAAIVLVLLAVFLGVLAFSLMPYLLRSIENSDYMGMIAMLLIILFVWLWAQRLRDVELPKDWKQAEVPKKQKK